MQAFITTLAIITAQAGTIDYGSQTMNPSHAGAFSPIGWSSDENYWTYDTELNGGGAMATAERVVVSTRGSAIKGYWLWDEGDSQPEMAWLNAVSADTYFALGVNGTGPGHLIYQFGPSFFQANHKLKPFNQLKMQYTFTLNGANHTVKLEQEWEPTWTPASPSPGAARYKRAKALVRVDGRVIGRIEFDDALGYSIDRIYLSPSRDCIAVSLARFTMVWFEGLNIVAEHRGLAARYR